MKKDLREALDQLRKAIEDEGPKPQYHRQVAGSVEAEWPTLMQAVRAVLAADKR